MPPLSQLTSCTPPKSNLYLANFLAAAVIERTLYRPLTFHIPDKMSLFLCLVRDATSRNTPPPGDSIGGVFYFRMQMTVLTKIFFSKSEAIFRYVRLESL